MKTVSLTPFQRFEVVALIGNRFHNVGHPFTSWSGNRHPWDASEFVEQQIKLLSSSSLPDTDLLFDRLENDTELASYRDFIRHERALHQKQQRESSFMFPSPKQVADSILNKAPATPSDLLAYIEDHLHVLSRELIGTQKERYRAYWNEEGPKLIKPKYETVCSKLLADDLQHRVEKHGIIVTVEHHMVKDKRCDIVALQGTERILPIEVKHHSHSELWTAWRTQLDKLYSQDANAGGLGIYLVLWSGEAKGGAFKKIPVGINRPSNAAELTEALQSLIPMEDQYRLRVVVIDLIPSD